MVLQREMPLAVWGTASSGEQVTVTIGSQTKTVATPASGTWTMKLDPMPAGGPYVMTVKGTNTVTLNDVYVGEVWQAAGQSNMDTRLNYTEYPNLAGEISKANYPLLRYYTLRQPGQTTTWEIVSPSTAGALSALAYFFGKEIQQKSGLAVGLVVTAVGGTTIASWLDPATLTAHPEVTDSDRGGMWRSWVAPVAGFGIRGTIWIQGEQNTNSSDAASYGQRFKWLIGGWRAAWGQGDFPFIFAQLSNIHAAQTDPNNTSYVAVVREGQRMALAVPGTAMSVNLDIGVANSWHFPNKPEAGHRLALPARATVYGETDLVYSGTAVPFQIDRGQQGDAYFRSRGQRADFARRRAAERVRHRRRDRRLGVGRRDHQRQYGGREQRQHSPADQGSLCLGRQSSVEPLQPGWSPGGIIHHREPRSARLHHGWRGWCGGRWSRRHRRGSRWRLRGCGECGGPRRSRKCRRQRRRPW